MNIKDQANELMKARGWTQVDLAKAVGIHHITLCRLLAKPVKRETAYDKLKDYLDSHPSPVEVEAGDIE